MSIEDVDDLESSLAHVDFDHENIDDEECTEKSELVRSIAHYTKVGAQNFIGCTMYCVLFFFPDMHARSKVRLLHC